jgi:isopentenyl-diphosphate delta-isomerase
MDTSMIPAWVNGELTPMDKLKVHERGLRHMAVSVFVLAGGAILLQRRALGKYHTPGYWANTCCTHPLWGESDADCARRRLEEELGITGLTPQYRGRVEYRADVGGGLTEHEVVEVFRAEAPRDLSVRPNSDEVMDTRWITRQDLEAELRESPEKFTPWLHIYMKEHGDLIFDDASVATPGGTSA